MLSRAQMDQRLLVNIGQLRALPARPCPGSDRGDIDVRQEIEHLESLLALDDTGERCDRRRLVEIVTFGDLEQLQMSIHQELDRLRVLLVETQTFTDEQGELRSTDGMVPLERLPDVVQQERDPQRQGVADLLVHRAKLQLAVVLLRRDPIELLKRPQCVSVDREVMVPIEADQALEPRELGQDAPEHSRLAHGLEEAPEIHPVAQDRHELPHHLAGVGVVVARALDPLSDPFADRFTEASVVLLRDPKDVEDLLGSPALRRFAREVEPTLVDVKVRGHSVDEEAPAELAAEEASTTGLGLQVVAEKPVGAPRVTVVVPHQHFDLGARVQSVTVAEVAGDRALRVPVENVEPHLVHVVKLAPHARIERIGRLEGQHALQGECSLARESVEGRAPSAHILDPANSLDVAQTTDPLLDLRLDHVDASGRIRERLSEQLELLGDEGPLATPSKTPERRAQEPLEQVRVPVEESRLEDRRRGGDVVDHPAVTLLRSPHGVPETKAGVPQQPHELRHAFDLGALLPEEQQIEIRVRTELLPPVAAHGDQGHLLGVIPEDRSKKRLQDVVDDAGVALRDGDGVLTATIALARAFDGEGDSLLGGADFRGGA